MTCTIVIMSMITILVQEFEIKGFTNTCTISLVAVVDILAVIIKTETTDIDIRC